LGQLIPDYLVLQVIFFRNAIFVAESNLNEDYFKRICLQKSSKAQGWFFFL
jgi:hypothetical protein